VSIAVRYPMVRETINQYINHLKQLTHQDMDTKNKEEIIDIILSDKKLIESAHYVASIWGECHRKIFTNVMDYGRSIAHDLKLGFTSYITSEFSFALSRAEWNGHCILFDFVKESEKYELRVGIWKSGDLVDEKLKKYLSDFKVKDYAPAEDAWAWGIKWESLSLFEILEKLSYNKIKEAVEAITKKLDEFEE
jgi:hypothetical protein